MAPGSIVTVRARLLPPAEVSTVERIWQERVGAGRLAVSWTWTSTWLRHFADAVRPRFAVVERRGTPIAAALVVVSRHRPRVSPVRRLHLGTAGEPAGHTVFVEYNDLLCAPANRRPVAATLLEAIRVAGGWDEFCVDGFRSDTAYAMRAVVPFDARAEEFWTIRLSAERSVLDGLKGPTRRLVRQARESLQPAKPEVADGVDAAADVLMAADGLENTVIAARLDIRPQVVSRWRERFYDEGLDGLEDRSQSGRPRVFSPSGGGGVTALACVSTLYSSYGRAPARAARLAATSPVTTVRMTATLGRSAGWEQWTPDS